MAAHTNPEQLRFPSIPGMTIRADFSGGALSSNFGGLLLSSVDRQVGLSSYIADAIHDKRHQSYVTHAIQEILAQRIYQIALAYFDGNDSNALRTDPVLKPSLGEKPLDEDNDLSSAATVSRFENSLTKRDIYRIAVAFVMHFIASYHKPPKLIVLDLDHSEDKTHGQQELACFNGHYGDHCYLPLFIFEGLSGKFVTAALRPGKTPKGSENAMILKRVLKLLRQAWPDTHIVLRGDSHFSNPELMAFKRKDAKLDFVFGVGGNSRLNALAAPHMKAVRDSYESRCTYAKLNGKPPLPNMQCFHELEYAAETWPKDIPMRIILKAEVNAKGDNPRFVVTTIENAMPTVVYRDFYCARGQGENLIKAVKLDLGSDRTSNQTFLANHMRLFLSCAAYVLHHTLRTEVLRDTKFAQAQPSTVILKLFKIAVRVVQYKDRIKLQLPSSYPFKAVLHKITEILYLTCPPVWNSS